MKAIIFLLITLGLSITPLARGESPILQNPGVIINVQDNQLKCQGNYVAKKVIYSVNLSSSDIYRSGCCSWHQGVCGCRNGRAVCCDGSLSPSCGC